MIPEKSTQEVIMSGDFKLTPFSIDAEDMPHIFDLLSSPYPTPRKAIIREYCTNALDEHVKHNISRPFEVSLPNQLSPFFKVRDFAKGLSPEQVDNIFVKYGRSTKRECALSNGMLGIGSKAGFCYGTRTFAVTSWNNGKKTIYNCFLDGDDRPQMATIFEEYSDEPSGLEISIPIAKEDFYNVISTACEEVLPYFSKKPIITTGQKIKELTYGELDEPGVYRFSRNELLAVMGNVAYPIDEKQINNIQAKHQSGITFFFENGDISFAQSRETLKYTARTIDNIQKRIEHAKTLLKGKIENALKDEKSTWEAAQKANKITANICHSNFAQGLSFNYKNKEWKVNTYYGFDLRFDRNSAHIDLNHKVKVYQWRMSYGKLRKNEIFYLTPNPDMVLYENDVTDFGKSSPTRIKEILKNNQNIKEVITFSFTDKEVKKRFLELTCIDCEIKQLSTVVLPKRAPQQKKAASAFTRTKMHTFNRKHNGLVSADYFIPAEVDVDDGKERIYCTTLRYDLLLGKDWVKACNVSLILNFAEITDTVYLIKSGAAEKITSKGKWIKLEDIIKKKFEEKLSKSGIATLCMGSNDFSENSTLHRFELKDFHKIENDKSPFKIYNQKIKFYKELNKDNPNVSHIRRYYQRLFGEFTFKEDIYFVKNDEKIIDSTYPLLAHMSNWELKQIESDVIIEYVNFIDNKNIDKD